MKRILALILLATMLLTLFVGCAGEPNATDPTKAQSPQVTDPNPTEPKPTNPGNNQPSQPNVPDKKDTVTIYASVPSDWATPYCWAWNSEGNAFDAWPGAAMTKIGNWYTIQVPSWVENVIISNNGTPQTQDLAIIKGSNAWVVVSSDGIGSVYDAEPSPSLPTDADMETKLNAELDALISSISGVIDTSVFDRNIGKISSGEISGSRYSYLTARQGAATITSVKMENHVFMGTDDITVGQLVAKGWSCNALEQKISPNYVASTLGSTPSGNKFSWRGWNNTNEEIPLKDCIVAGFGLDYDLGDRAQPYINDTLITKDTTLLQFLDSVGCPSKIQITQNFEDGECQTSFIYLTYNNLEVVFRAFQGSTVLYSISLEL